MGRETYSVKSSAFYEIVSVIENARIRAYKAVNRELITMYSQNIWRMKQFFVLYSENEFLSPLVREISWNEGH